MPKQQKPRQRTKIPLDFLSGLTREQERDKINGEMEDRINSLWNRVRCIETEPYESNAFQREVDLAFFAIADLDQFMSKENRQILNKNLWKKALDVVEEVQIATYLSTMRAVNPLPDLLTEAHILQPEAIESYIKQVKKSLEGSQVTHNSQREIDLQLESILKKKDSLPTTPIIAAVTHSIILGDDFAADYMYKLQRTRQKGQKVAKLERCVSLAEHIERCIKDRHGSPDKPAPVEATQTTDPKSLSEVLQLRKLYEELKMETSRLKIANQSLSDEVRHMKLAMGIDVGRLECDGYMKTESVQGQQSEPRNC